MSTYDNTTSDRQKRTDRAMGEAMYALVSSSTDEENKSAFELPDVMKNDRARAKELSALPDEDRALLKELCSFFGHDRTEGNEIKEVFRAKQIIEELSMNVNFAALPYGETFLSSSVGSLY